ncbi:MAG: hypothetical protein IT384_06295 [Deltaproteobacteria bacterium]|nr:hypothetical protein [Deltaproteobacteria bacterium]
MGDRLARGLLFLLGMVDAPSKTKRDFAAFRDSAAFRERERQNTFLAATYGGPSLNHGLLSSPATVIVRQDSSGGSGETYYYEGQKGDAHRLRQHIKRLAQSEWDMMTVRVGIPGQHADWESAPRGAEALDLLRSIQARLRAAERQRSAYEGACASPAASRVDERAAALELEAQRITVRDAVHRGPPSTRTPRPGFHMGDGDWEIAQHQMHWLIDSHGRHEWAQLAKHVGAGYAFERATAENVLGDYGQKFLLVKDGQPIGPEAWVAVDWPRDAAPSPAAAQEILTLIRQAFDLHQANEDLSSTLARIRELSSASFNAGLTAP